MKSLVQITIITNKQDMNNKKEPDQVEESDSEIKDLNDLLKGHDEDKKN